jgi:hypothetical protein
MARDEQRGHERVPCHRQAVSIPGASIRLLDADGNIVANSNCWNLAPYLAQVDLLHLPEA